MNNLLKAFYDAIGKEVEGIKDAASKTRLDQRQLDILIGKRQGLEEAAEIMKGIAKSDAESEKDGNQSIAIHA